MVVVVSALPDVSETPDEKRARYLRLAAEANKYATRARRLEMREACLNMVQSWLGLARDSDQQPK
jgi:hypothetical protein